ncbi:MAG TPA: hypothetical protein VK850_08105, partial [Candidatus Binatia bacterium]|nr:hypothetical protein [Candidatus Binatia bacterium]
MECACEFSDFGNGFSAPRRELARLMIVAYIANDAAVAFKTRVQNSAQFFVLAKKGIRLINEQSGFVRLDGAVDR